MNDLLKQIDQLIKLRAAATPGPWAYKTNGNSVQSHAIPGVCSGMSPKTGNAAFIAAAGCIDFSAIHAALDEAGQLAQQQLLDHLNARATPTPAPATAAPGAAGETGEAPGIWKHDVAIVPLSAQYWHNAAKKCSTMEGRAACLVQAWDHLVSHLYALNGR